MKIKIISAILVIALTLSSCGLIVIGNDEGSRNPQVTETVDSAKSPEGGDLTNNAETDSAGDTASPETASDRAKKRVAALQSDNFSGQSFIIASSSQMTFATDVESYYDRALLLRDSIVEEKYNIDIISVYADDRTMDRREWRKRRWSGWSIR